MRLNALFGLILALVAATSSAEIVKPESLVTLSRQQVEEQLPASHPAYYYLYAKKLFNDGAKEDALFWFYVGQLRYRFYLTVNPKLSNDADVFGALQETVGSVINGWAGGDPDIWAKGMQRALDWDAANDNSFTSKSLHAEDWQKIRSGLEDLKKYVLTHKAEILEKRKHRGL
jgi:hypothetical protein